MLVDLVLMERLEDFEPLPQAVEVARRIHAREEELQARAVSTIRPLLEAEKALELAELDRELERLEDRLSRRGIPFEEYILQRHPETGQYPQYPPQPSGPHG